MNIKTIKKDKSVAADAQATYQQFYSCIAEILESARHTVVRTTNSIMTATYWEIGRRIVEFEQGGKTRAAYGKHLLKKLSIDLTASFGRGFAQRNIFQMRAFYLTYPVEKLQTLSAISSDNKVKARNTNESQQPNKSKVGSNELIYHTVSDILQTPSAKFTLTEIAACFPLPWSAYVRLISIKSEQARRFYETEALRGGWSVRQLNRQIESQFYERTAASKNKAAMLTKVKKSFPEDHVTPEEAIKDPYLLEFLQLKDEYSESDLEEALIRHLEGFLLELGGDFCFVGRQKRLRIGDEWYRVDLLFFHRKLRCLVIIDLKLGKLTHADAGQMHLYLNYAVEHWTHPEENPPVGLILCAHKNEALAKYALHNLPNKVMAAEYKTILPDETLLAHEIDQTRKTLDARRSPKKTEK